MSKIIQNINVLDVTTASDQALEGISKIGNVNVLLYSKATSGLLANIAFDNVNIQAEVPENSVLSQVNGRYEVGESLGADKALFIMVNGMLLFRPETTIEEVDKGIAGVLVNGSIYCPESLQGIVRQKIMQHNGHFGSYMDDAKLIGDSVRLDNAFLHTLQPGSNIAFGGKVTMLDDVDASLLEAKLNKVDFLKKLVVREGLLPLISGKIVNAHKVKIITVPDDTYYVESDLTLNKSVLRRVKNRRIHASGVLLFDSDVTPEDLDKSVDSLHSETMMICREDLKDVVLQKTADPTVEVLGYSGKLKLIDAEYKLSAAELKYSKEPLSFIVHGVMNIAADIDPDLLFDSLGFIVNHGVIIGSTEHCGIVQIKMLKNNGVVTDTDHEEDNDAASPSVDDDNVFIRNANFLKL